MSMVVRELKSPKDLTFSFSPLNAIIIIMRQSKIPEYSANKDSYIPPEKRKRNR